MRQAKRGVILLFVFSLLLMSEVKNADRPANGEWSFELEKVWTVKEIGGKILAMPFHLTVSDDDTLYGYERKYKTNFILSKNGKLVKFFGKKGEGPGEIKNQFSSYFINDKLIIADIDRMHFFTKNGEFIKAIRNNFFVNEPTFFLNENEFISATKVHPNQKEKMGEITRHYLKSGSKKLLTEFSVFRKATAHTKEGNFTFTVESMTPLMIVGHGVGRLYFGMNHTYEISITDLAGKKLNTFSLDREKKKVTIEEKRKYFAGRWRGRAPEAAKRIMNGLPDELTYFIRIEEHNKLIYVFIIDWSRKNAQQIDIFSPEGRYLYRSFIRLDENFTISHPQRLNPIIKKGHLYIIVENEDGEIMISKYKMKLPQH